MPCDVTASGEESAAQGWVLVECSEFDVECSEFNMELPPACCVVTSARRAAKTLLWSGSSGAEYAFICAPRVQAVRLNAVVAQLGVIGGSAFR